MFVIPALRLTNLILQAFDPAKNFSCGLFPIWIR